MKTKKRFFLKAAGISLAKAAGISLAFVLTFALAFAACDTGTSNSGKKTETDDTDTGNVPSTPVPNPVYTTYRDSTGNYVLTITESGGAFSYTLAVSGVQRSYGTVTKGTPTWTFRSSYTGESFTMNVSGIEPNLTFTGSPTITADNGGTVTIPTLSLTGSSGENTAPPSELPVTKVGDETQLRDALAKDDKGYKQGVFRITSSELTLTKARGDLVVHEGQHIVVGGTGDSVGQYSAGGPLFAITNASNILNIEAGLRLESGATLTIARGAAVNVKSGGVLHAASDAGVGAKVGVGVNVSGGNLVNIGTSGQSNLYIAAGGALHIEGDPDPAKSGLSATLAVNNTTAASKVTLESATGALPPGALTLEKNAILRVEGGSNPLTDAAVDDKGVPIPVGTAEADRIIGTTSASVIEIPAAASLAAIGAVTVKGYEGTSVASGIEGAFTTAAGLATTNSTAATTHEVAKLQGLLDSKTRVTYSGTEAITSATAPGKTLIITGVAKDATNVTIKVGTLEIADGAILSLAASAGTIDPGTLTNNGTIEVTNATAAANFAALVGIPNTGTGKVLLKAAVTGLTAPLTLGTDLEIGASGSIAFTDAAQPAFSGSGKTVAILSTNITANALSLPGKISGYGTGVTVTNAGTHADAITTGTTSVDVLNTLLAAKGNITTGTITVGEAGTADDSAALTVPDNTALTITTLAVNDEDSVLTVSVGTTDSILKITNPISTNDGTIKTANAAVLATLLGKVQAGIVEVTDTIALAGSLTPTLGANVTLKIAQGKVLTIPSTTTLTVSGTIDANGGTTGSITSTAGLIEAADATKLATVLAQAGVTGRVSVKGTQNAATITDAALLAGQVLYIPAGLTLTVSGTVSGAGGITNDGIITLGAAGSITASGTNANSGTINTAATVTPELFGKLVGFANSEGTGKVVLKGTVTATGNITLTQKLEIDASAGVLNLGAYTITTANITKNDGTIKTATGVEATLRALVGIAGTGEVEWNHGTSVAITLTNNALALTTQDLTIGANATLNLATFALTEGGTGEVTNNGTIKTAAATVDALDDVLALGGVIEIEDFTVDHATNPTTLTVPASTILTVPNNRTLTLGGINAGTLVLTDNTSKLVLLAGGTVNAAHDDSTIVSTGNVESAVKVSAVDTSSSDAPTAVTNTGSSTNWVLTKGVRTSAPVVTVILGKFKLVTTKNAVLTDKAGATENTNNEPGTLKAGADTTITFAGTSA